MDSNTSHPTFALPSVHLREYISHYWLSSNNTDSHYSVIPDGSVDIVINIGSHNRLDLIYGTSTAITEIPIHPGHHYLEISIEAEIQRRGLG